MKNYKNKDRNIGVELEFYGLNPEVAAKILVKEIDGQLERKHEDLYEVSSKYGVFKLETDAKLIQRLSESSEKNKHKSKTDYDGFFKDALKIISDEIVPTELVTPPLKIKDLNLVNKIQSCFVASGAKGTTESFRFAFAAQLNPEVESLEADYILNSLKSFIILSDWLKDQIRMDLTRKLTSYASDFPKDYVLKIFHPKYKPSLDGFIEDYLEYNPTRNRGLDLLPLLSFINEKKVMSVVKDEKVNSWPTFHYRLPNSQLSLKSWNIEVEWSRWLLVEKVRKETSYFEKMCRHFYDIQQGSGTSNNWLLELNNYVESFRK